MLEEAFSVLDSSTQYIRDRLAVLAKQPHPADKHQLARMDQCYKSLAAAEIQVQKAGSPLVLMLTLSSLYKEVSLGMLQCALPTDRAETVAAAFCATDISLQELADLYQHVAYKQCSGHVPYRRIPQLLEWLDLPPLPDPASRPEHSTVMDLDQ